MRLAKKIFNSPKEEALWRVFYRGESFDKDFLTALARESRLAVYSRHVLLWVVPFLVLGGLGIFLLFQDINYRKFVQKGVPIEALLIEKRPGQWRKPRLVYEYEFAGREYQGSGVVPDDVFSQFEVGDPIPVLVLEQNPARSMSEWVIGPPADPWPYYAGVGFLSLVWLVYLLRERWENRYYRLGTRMVLSMGRRDADPAVRAVLEEYHHRGGREDFPAAAEHWCTPILTEKHGIRPFLRHSAALIRWAGKQSQPPDMDSYLARAAIALHWLAGCRRPMPVFEARPPDRIRLLSRQAENSQQLQQCPSSGVVQLLSALAGQRIFDFPTDGMDSLSLDLRGFDREEILQAMAKAEGIRVQVFSRRGLQEDDLEEQFQRRLRENNLDALYSRERIPLSMSTRGREDVEWARLYPVEAIEFVNSVLYFFYLCPWRWKPVERDFEIQTPGERQVRFRLEFHPGRRLRVRRL
jgi:hypothetical protein